MAKQLNARIITKHDTEENWNKAETFIPKLGEIIITDTVEGNTFSQYRPETLPRIKIGDGKTLCKDLHYITDTYVKKEPNKQLSEKNYTQVHYDIIEEIANLDYKPVYKDTTYTAGRGLGLKNNEFYSMGVIGLSESNENGHIKFIYNTGPNSSDYAEKDVIIHGLTTTAFTPLNKFLTSDALVEINNAVTQISSSYSEDEIYITYKNAIGETTTFELEGLGKLAFKDGFDGDFVEVTEVAVRSSQPTNAIPIWINNETNILKFYDVISDTYKDISVGVTEIKKINDAILRIEANGITKNIDITPNLSMSEGPANGTIQIDLNGSVYVGKVKGLQDIAYSTDSFLKLTGGTVTGITTFSHTQNASSTTTGAVRITGGLGVAGNIYGKAVYGAVYNDYAEYRQSEEPIEPGYIVYSGDDGILHKTVGRLQFFEGVVSDTFGFAIGKTDRAQTPLAVAGRVLVYTDEELHAGNVVCAGPYGKACKMTKQEIKDHPDRIVGVVSEVPSYETWGEENIPVNGRVWIRVK